jgi:hypothetical protein
VNWINLAAVVALALAILAMLRSFKQRNAAVATIQYVLSQLPTLFPSSEWEEDGRFVSFGPEPRLQFSATHETTGLYVEVGVNSSFTHFEFSRLPDGDDKDKWVRKFSMSGPAWMLNDRTFKLVLWACDSWVKDQSARREQFYFPPTGLWPSIDEQPQPSLVWERRLRNQYKRMVNSQPSRRYPIE